MFFRPDHWKCYVQYFEASFNLIDSAAATSTDSQENGEQTTDSNGSSENANNSQTELSACDVLNTVIAFLNDQIELMLTDDQYADRPLRGPFLAKLELLKRLKQRKKDEAQLLSDVQSCALLLEQYYDKFGDKPCCFSDIRPYMALLPVEEQVSVSCFDEYTQYCIV